MHTFKLGLIIGATLAFVILGACNVHGASNERSYEPSGWYIAPSGSYIMPSDSHMQYYGMPGKVQYKNGYNAGIKAGKHVNGGLDIYGSYDYSSYKAKSATVYTPAGNEQMGLSDLYHTHTAMINADIRPFKGSVGGFKPVLGAGVGMTANYATSPVWEARAGLEQKHKNRTISLGWAIRRTDGNEVYAHKNISQPTTNGLFITTNWNF